MSTGAHGLVAACALWVACGLLVLLAMKRINNNATLVRRLNRKRRREEIVRGDGATANNNDRDGAVVVVVVEDDDVESHPLGITSGKVCIISKKDNEDSGSSRKVDESEIILEDDSDDALNTTIDTEDSDFSLSLEEGCD
eukprot:CAMPEP_0201628754 /NCGR_PEP_ID=MMETSP0493-20130528/3624_1 /ASSEMBLY_ACC=CAM_ASM_000838 /TAXON_ID=420259 /ORGANISM="Thalassiosira gravida, Strain GMp14c1" /LENGTH=139 /DNA_ID=CAMNT_0048099593 /DNA_START=360 /DNA_END=779 /DNA_ORIENTATION=+